MDDVEGLSDDDDDYTTRKEAQNSYVSLWAFVKSDGTNQQVLLANGTVKPLSEFESGSVDDTNYLKKTGQATQSIEGNLIRSGSEISFENLQLFLYITKQDAKYGFVQKEGQQVLSIEGKLRKKQDDDEEEEGQEDDDYLSKKESDGKFVQLGGTQMITGAKTLIISITAPAFVKYSGTNQLVLLADETVKQLSEFSSDLQMGDISNKINDWNMSISPLCRKLYRLGVNPKICEFGTLSEVISPTRT
ncbi:MAG: hypothetical protein EZS28_046853 [Streblomastix strix]|uniref:Uncharacterized protein n=1 Tax=Streblomastix strix TaxID=222440 RepID=A0A5J4TIN5_9EUKA|nr:MAG: hypothetical protein EZS28_046853 [Streblomastix strix]